MSKTVVGLFPTMAKAEEVKQALRTEGFTANVVANGSGPGSMSQDSDASTDEGIGQKISNFFHGLTGGDEDVHRHYAEGVNTGGALVGVACEDADAMEVAALLKQHGAREVEGKTTSDLDTTRAAYDASEAGRETAIPIVEEQLAVGKREVDRGGVRVYSHVVEQPVSADVTHTAG